MIYLIVAAWLVAGFSSVLIAIRVWPEWWLENPRLTAWWRLGDYLRSKTERPADDGRRHIRSAPPEDEFPFSLQQFLVLALTFLGPGGWVATAATLILKGNIQSVAKKTAARKEIEAELARAKAEIDAFMKGGSQ